MLAVCHLVKDVGLGAEHIFEQVGVYLRVMGNRTRPNVFRIRQMYFRDKEDVSVRLELHASRCIF